MQRLLKFLSLMFPSQAGKIAEFTNRLYWSFINIQVFSDHNHKPGLGRLFLSVAVTYKEIQLCRGALCSSHYNNVNSKIHFLSVMSPVRSLLLCCEQISVWLFHFRGQNAAICHIWQPSRYSPQGIINSILNLTEVLSLCTVHIYFIKGRLDMQCTGKHPLASHLNVMHPNIQRPFYVSQH